MSDTLSIAELAGQVGMTVRNVRAYQSRGLLHPPEIRGRVAHYNSSHVSRLKLVTSLQDEDFTLAAIKRLLDSPDSYAAIVSDRRRRFRDDTSDIPPTVALPVEQIRAALPDLPADLTKTGLVWEEDGRLVTHTLLLGVGRTLAGQGVPPELLARLQIEAANVGRELAKSFATVMGADDRAGSGMPDLAKVAVQLAAGALEIAFLDVVRSHTKD